MKNLTLLAMTLFAVVFCTSCGTPKEREVNVSNVEISGFIKDYLEVVDGTYKFTHDGNEASITIKLKLIASPTSIPEENAFATIDLNPIGGNGEIFDTGNGLYSKFQAFQTEFDKIKDLLNGTVGDTKAISFKWEYFRNGEPIANKIFKEAEGFELVDTGFTGNESSESGIGSDESVDSSSEGSSAKWDAILDDYDSYCTKYIACVKKVQAGDVDAISDMASLLEIAQDLGDKLKNASNDLSSAQMARYTKITAKFTAAMASSM